MEIFVEGTANKYVTPNQVIASIYFKTSAKTYNDALSKGMKNVDNFNKLIDEINKKIQTKTFSINEERIYNEESKKTEVNGYVFNQFATLKFDYDNKVILKLLSLIENLENAPEINFSFPLKDESKYLDELINEAYLDATKKAQMIAKSANKELKEIVTIDLNGSSNSQNRISESNFDSSILKVMNINNIDTNVICPEDIEIQTKIFCKWNAL